ncbi:MAG: hypothetical protein KatS3mg102_2616 [Planctomycetota bacterium]|nr:MAG: hypothetical protein KatS3mg102_2616 [Planctomycetota bacterium]
MRRAVGIGIAAALLLAAAASGCAWHVAYEVPAPAAHVHVHGYGCGHYYWHGAWRAVPHPADCAICAAEIGVVHHRIEAGGEAVHTSVHLRLPAVRVHVHGPGCGHYFWHGAWYAYPHPADCRLCVRSLVLHHPVRVVVPPVHTRVYVAPRYCPPAVSYRYGYGWHRHWRGGRIGR